MNSLPSCATGQAVAASASTASSTVNTGARSTTPITGR